jgi:hypothetical protein
MRGGGSTYGTLNSGNLWKIRERNFIVTHTLVKIGEQRGGFGRDHCGFAVGSSEGIDSGERFPVRGDDELNRAGERTRADRCAEEPLEALQLRLHGFLEMTQVSVRERRSRLRRPKTGDHVRRT